MDEDYDACVAGFVWGRQRGRGLLQGSKGGGTQIADP